MTNSLNSDQQIGVFRDTIISLVRRDGPDLSARQLGILLTCYLEDGPHTVRGLAVEMSIAKPAVTRALNKLEGLDLARRKVDPTDRRSVIIQRTVVGASFVRDVRDVLEKRELHREQKKVESTAA